MTPPDNSIYDGDIQVDPGPVPGPTSPPPSPPISPPPREKEAEKIIKETEGSEQNAPEKSQQRKEEG